MSHFFLSHFEKTIALAGNQRFKHKDELSSVLGFLVLARLVGLNCSGPIVGGKERVNKTREERNFIFRALFSED
jgi:hypothetical protein